MEEATGHRRRRSARLWELEEKARAGSLQKKHAECSSLLESPSSSVKKRTRKRKSLLDVVVNSVASNIQQEGENTKCNSASTENDQPSNLSSLQQMPNKQTLEFILDVLQRRDKEELFSQPVDPDEVVDYYNIIKEPMDFGTMRAKLQEGLYTSLEQFKRDVFLISSNAMEFNSSATVYYTEARALSELARRVFNLLRTEPENFKLEYSRTRKRPSRKCQNEARSSQDKLDKQESRDLANLNPPEVERRLTYTPQKNESTVSTVYNAPKQLNPVSNADMRYAESLMKFVKDLGPTVQTFALAKIEKLSMKPPNSPSCSQPSLGNTLDVPVAAHTIGKTTDFPLAASSSLRRFSHPNGDNIGHVPPRPFLPNATSSSKGKEVCVDPGMDFCNVYKGENIPIDDTYYEARAYPTNGGHKNRTSLEEKDIQTSGKMDPAVSSSGKTVDEPENLDLLIATVMQISAFQNRNSKTPSGSYFPVTGNAAPSQFTGGFQSWMQNQYQNIQAANVSSATPVIDSLCGYQSQYPNGEGSSSRAAAVLEPNYSVQQPMKLNHSIPKAANDHLALQRKSVAQHAFQQQQQPQISPSGQNTALQQQVQDTYPSGQNTFVRQKSQISSLGQNTFMQQQSQISPPGQSSFMQKQSQISPPHQNTFLQQQSHISPPSQNTFLQQQSHISPPSQNILMQQQSRISPPNQNILMQQQSHISPPSQNILMQQQQRISPSAQNTFIRQQSQIPPSGPSTFMQQQSQISPSGQNTIQLQSLISSSGQNTLLQSQSQLPPSGQNTFMQHQSQISPSGQNTFMPPHQSQRISPSGQNIVMRQQSQISPTGQNAFLQQRSQISPSGQNTFLRQQSQISPSGQNTFLRQQLQISPSGQNTFMRQQTQISQSGQNTIMRQQSQISTSGQNTFMRQQSQISPSGQNTFMSQQSQISSSGQNTFMQQQASQIPPSDHNSLLQQPPQISPSDHDSLLQQQQYISRKHDMPFFDALNLLEIDKTPLGNEAEPSNSQCYWDIQGSPLVDSQKPDLALQL